MRPILVTALCAMLAACGGGGGDSAPAVNIAAIQSAPRAPVVATFGDSIMVAEQAALQAHVGDVLEHSTAGETLQTFMVSKLSVAVATAADVVVIAYGTNDALLRAENYSPAQFGAALSEAVTKIRAGHVVVLETPPRVLLDLVPAGRFGNLGAGQYADQIRAVGAALVVVVCDREREATAADQPDGIHPVRAVSERNAAALAECIKAATS